MNQFSLVGRLYDKPDLSKSSNGFPYTEFLLEVPKPFADADGNTEKEIYKITAWRNYAEEVSKLDKGELLAIRGRLQARSYTKDDNIFYVHDLIADKVTTPNSY